MNELRLLRRFDAPPERVFEAWTDPEVLRRSWAAHPDWDSPAAEDDPRPGGHYRLSMTDTASGETRTVTGRCSVVEAPRRLVWEGMPTETLVTVEFHPGGEGTGVELHQVGFPDEHDRELHADGWRWCPDNLARRVFPDG